MESRVGSLEHMNLLTRGRTERQSPPPLSGRSTPNSPNRDYLHKYHTVSIITLINPLLLFDYYFMNMLDTTIQAKIITPVALKLGGVIHKRT